MFLLFSIVALFMAPSPGASASLSRVTALKFAPNSYIRYRPDWNRLTSAISICAWIKDTGSDHRAFFSYHTSPYVLTIMADGSNVGILGTTQQLQSEFPVPKGTWHFVCVTWSLESRDHKYYVNGVLLGSKQTAAGRSLRTGGELSIGKWYLNSGNYAFAGEMAYLNVYATELSSGDIVSMMELGMCSIEVDKHESSRVIRWEELLVQRRSGTITDGYIGECIEMAVGEMTETRAEKEKLSKNLNSTIEELEETQRRLNSTLAELGEERALKNRTWDWQIFLSDQFLDQTFTVEHARLLHSSWNNIADRLVGIRITDEFLKLTAYLDHDDDRPWSILYSKKYFNETFTKDMADRVTNMGLLKQMVGVPMTKEVIALLEYVTDKSNCIT